MNFPSAKYLLWLHLFLFFSISLSAQTDREFWFVAPEISADHEDNPVRFRFSTAGLPAHIRVEMPANAAFIPYEFDIPSFSIRTLDVTSQLDAVEDRYAALDGIHGKNNKGIHITSSSRVNCYYEVGQTYNPEIISLLGSNGLGTEFFTSFQTRMLNMNISSWDDPAYSAFEVVFTEDNTYLTIQIPSGKAVYNGTEAPYSGTVTIGPFNRGETYQGAPAWITNPKTGKYVNDTIGRSAADHLAGTKLTTNGKKIAVILKDDSMKSLVGGCYNLAADQTIPVHRLGKEYIVVKGQLLTGTLNSTYYNPPPVSPVNQETIHILATEDSTRVFLDGAYKATIQAGETYTSEIVNAVTRITVQDSGAYVWQITGTGCEMSGAILPPLSPCSGSMEVAFTRSSSDAIFLIVIVPKTAKGGFSAFINGTPQSNLTDTLNNTVYTDVTGSDWAVAKITATPLIPVLNSVVLKNKNGSFHAGILHGGVTNGTRYAYFTNYGVEPLGAYIPGMPSNTITICKGDSVQISGIGGTYFNWYPDAFISNHLFENPVVFPLNNTRYSAFIKGNCNRVDTASVLIEVKERPRAAFTLSSHEGNSPLSVQATNTSLYAGQYEWTFGGDTGVYTLPNAMHVFINHLDTLQKFPVRLKADNLICSDEAMDTVLVWPELIPEFELSNSSGCPPLQITFTNKSTCNFTHAEWQVGDSIFTDPGSFAMTFDRNYWPDDSIPVMLKLKNRFGRTDSLTRYINLFPPACMGIIQDAHTGCSPLLVNFSAQGEGNASHQWIISSKDTLTGGSVNNVFTNRTTVNKTIQILLVSGGDNLCPSEHSTTVVVKPELSSKWSVSAEICSGKQITCQPVVYGVHPPYKLKFSDGTLVENFRFGNVVTFSPLESGLITLLQLDDNGGCTLVSPNTLLAGSLSVTVLSPPEIISQYADQTVMEGDPVHLQILVNGSEPMNYQWKKDGTLLENQVDNEIFLPSVLLTDSGYYQAIISNGCDTMQSAGGYLSVIPGTGINPPGNAFALYPNPASSILHLAGMPPYITRMEVYSIDGRLLHTEKAGPVLHLDFLCDGIYLLHLKDRRGEQKGIYRFTVVRTH